MRARILSLWLAVIPAPAAAGESPVDMSYVETKDITLIHYDGLRYLAPHAIRTYMSSLAWQRRTFGWMPSEPTIVVLNDLTDVGNAAQTSAPHNKLVFDVAPESHAFETFPATERFFFLMNHEMVHVASGDVANEEDRMWRRLMLGKVSPQWQHPESIFYSFLTIPRFNSPRWYNEGAAVFMETWMSGGLGRAQGGYDEMVFRAMVRDNARFHDPLGLASYAVRVNFQVGVNAYLYGTRFFTWLAYAHSPGKVVEWIRRDEGSARYYSDNFQRVFGIPVEQAWQEWIAFEREFQRENLAEIRKFPITPYRKLVDRALGSVSRMQYDEAAGTLYAAYRYPGVVDHIGALNIRDGTVQRLVDIKRALLFTVTSLAYDQAGGTLFFVNDNAAYRDLMALDVKTGEERMLLEDARIGELAYNRADRSLWGIRIANGIASLVRIPHPYREWVTVREFPYDYVPYDLDISPDGSMLSASVGEANGDQFLRVWTIGRVLAGDMKPYSEFRFGQSVPESFVFTHDGKYLYGSSYYTGASNIFRYEVGTGAVEAVTNAETGFFRPLPLADGRLLALAYTADGFVPAMIEPKVIKDVSAIRFLGAEVAEKHPVVKTWQVASASAVEYEKLVTNQGPYVPLRHVGLDNAFPVLQGYKDSIGIGYHFNFSDPLGYANFGLTAAFTPDHDLPGQEQGHLELTGQYLGWKASLSYNRSDFYDLFGPTKKSRKGYAAKLGYTDWRIYDPPRTLRLTSEIAFYDKIDALPNYQNVEAPVDRLVTAEVGLRYNHPRRSLGAVDDDKGVNWEGVATVNHANGNTVPQFRGGFDFGLPLPMKHSSLWLRTVAGTASGERTDPFANFYFGGFGNNYVDSGEIKRYREYYALPGFGLNEISGRTFARQMVEWNVPPVIFEKGGTPSFHAAWLRPSLFASALWTDPRSSELRKDYYSVGTQLDLRFSVLHWYDMTLSIGYAAGYRGSRRAGDEWMVSLKIL
jgi:hypothetical protein